MIRFTGYMDAQNNVKVFVVTVAATVNFNMNVQDEQEAIEDHMEIANRRTDPVRPIEE